MRYFYNLRKATNSVLCRDFYHFYLLVIHPFDHGQIRLFWQAMHPTEINQMAGFIGFGLQVEAVVLIGLHDVRDAPGNADSIFSNSSIFLGLLVMSRMDFTLRLSSIWAATL